MRTTSSSLTTPSSVQPNTVDSPDSIIGRLSLGKLSRKSQIFLALAIASSGVMRTFDRLCDLDTEIVNVSLCTPACMARCAPVKLGASAATLRPGSVNACATTSGASIICGISFGGTNEQTSISRKPASAAALIQRFLYAVGINALVFCSPSRGPTSLIKISMSGDTGFSCALDTARKPRHHTKHGAESLYSARFATTLTINQRRFQHEQHQTPPSRSGAVPRRRIRQSGVYRRHHRRQ